MNDMMYLGGCPFCDQTNYSTLEGVLGWYIAHLIRGHWDLVLLMRDDPRELAERMGMEL